MTLHILNSLSNKNSQFENCINSTCDGDDIVFLSTDHSTEEKEEIIELINRAMLLDVNLYRISNPELDEPALEHQLKQLSLATQKDFLNLSVKHEKSITWF